MPAAVFSGSRARVKINGTQIGYAAGVSGSESVEYDPVEVLDLLEVKEFVPVAYRVTLNAQIFRVIGQSLKKQGIFPTESNILTSGDLKLTIEDRLAPNDTMAQFEGVKAATNSWDVTARGITQSNVDFVAIRLRDEFDNPTVGA